MVLCWVLVIASTPTIGRWPRFTRATFLLLRRGIVLLRHSAPQWHRAPASAHSYRNLLPSGPSGATTSFSLLRSGRVNWRRHHCVAARGFRYGVRSSWTPWGGPVQHCGVSSAHSSPRDRSDQLSNVLRSPRHQGRRFTGGDKRVSACQSIIWIIVLFSPRHVF